MKKGNMVLDGILVVVILSLLAIVIPIVVMIVTNYNASVQASDTLGSTSKTLTQTAATNFPGWADNVFTMAFIFLWIAVVVSSFMTDTHPIFFILSALLFIVVIIFGMIMSNTEQSVVTSAGLAAYNAGLVKTNFIMTHLAEALIVMGVSIAIVLFGKARRTQ